MSANQNAEFIGYVKFMLSGPSLKAGRAAKRGFTILFTLLNDDHQKIADDGKVDVVIKHWNNNPFSKQKYIFQISASDFSMVKVTNYGPRLGEIELFGCLLRHDKPVFIDTDFWMAEIWFNTTDGRKLYGKSR